MKVATDIEAQETAERQALQTCLCNRNIQRNILLSMRATGRRRSKIDPEGGGAKRKHTQSFPEALHLCPCRTLAILRSHTVGALAHRGETAQLLNAVFTLVERVLLKTFQNLNVSSPAPVTIASPSGDIAYGERRQSTEACQAHFLKLLCLPFLHAQFAFAKNMNSTYVNRVGGRGG